MSLEIEKFVDEWGPEKMLHAYDPKTGMKGVLVMPDIIANAGGVTSSYAEYRGYNPKQMLRLVQRKIRRNTITVLEYAEEKDMGLRDAALNIAKERMRRARGY